MGKGSKSHKKESFYKVCTKKLGADHADLKEANVESLKAEEATFKTLNVEEQVYDDLTASKLTVGQINVTGQTSASRGVVSRDTETGMMDADYLLVQDQAMIANNLRVNNTCRIRKYTGDDEDNYDEEETFDIAKEIHLLRQEV